MGEGCSGRGTGVVMTDLPRSTRTGRGELAGPASSPRQVRQVTVRIIQVEPGVLRLSTPFWVGGVARTAPDLARLVASAFVEAQCHAYSTFRGYDEDGRTTYRRPRPQRRGNRPDTHHPSAWQSDPDDGSYISPTGRRYRPDTEVAERVRKRRIEAGLSEIPDPPEPSRGGLLNGRST